MAFDLALYETVAQRLVRWWETFPNGRIITVSYTHLTLPTNREV